MTGKKVYLLYEIVVGDDFDYDFDALGVYTDKETAGRAAEVLGGSVEELPLDPFAEELQQGLSPWEVRSYGGKFLASVRGDPFLHWGEVRHDFRGMAFVYVWAKDKDEAIKKAKEILGRESGGNFNEEA